MNLSRIDSSNINKSESFEPKSTGMLFKKFGYKSNGPYYERSKSRAVSTEKTTNNGTFNTSISRFATPEAKKYNDKKDKFHNVI